jgi:hypothetical protein
MLSLGLAESVRAQRIEKHGGVGRSRNRTRNATVAVHTDFAETAGVKDGA